MFASEPGSGHRTDLAILALVKAHLHPAPALPKKADNLLVQIHSIIVMIRCTGLAPWEFEFPFRGSLISTFLVEVDKLRGQTSRFLPSSSPTCTQLLPSQGVMRSGFRFIGLTHSGLVGSTDSHSSHPQGHEPEHHAFSPDGRGAARAEDAQGTPTQNHISPSILVYEN